MSVELTFLTRRDCHLCETARENVQTAIASRDVTFTEVDVDTDADLRDKYGWDVPVVLLDGRQHSFYRVDPQRLARAIDALIARRP
ncbi:glutaredoxin family protein [Nocardia zapadnayensis]|nr:glutaredoxin family protein [Nocardia zapadnayensis]MCX0277212.1 glutaredoxin family protein [Nocardia zapadnayensis]